MNPWHYDPRTVPRLRQVLARWYRATPVTREERRSGEGDWAARWRRILFADPCPYCAEAVSTVDHIVARARGGRSSWTNITGACVPCNSAKGATPLLLFVLQRTLAARPKPPRRQVTQRLGLFAQRLAAALGLEGGRAIA